MDLREICLPIQREAEELERFLTDKLASRVPFVQSVASYVIQNGGKRLRPILTVLSAKLAGYKGSAAVPLGTAVEYMHTASLLHDDVIDNAQLRRGRASINNKWGNHVSVLVGDFFYCRAMDLLVQSGDLRILKVLTDVITTTTEGEIFEITKSNDLATTEKDYLQIITSKTAALMAGACQAGAILGNVSEEFEHALRKFGLNLGIAFQLQDDILDYIATEEEFGKKHGTDLNEGKLTLPLILALKKCSEEELRIVKDTLISDSIDPAVFSRILAIINRYDGIRETGRLAKDYIDKAKDSLSLFRPSLERDTLLSIADYVVLRKN
ncbi:MAG: polyprenyl synthetase family protein [Deltaproteobacteria bacterium]|nr:polyprenyl synthetase family protein [Deltaproteobacteria bacterium]